ncbi:response regulator [Paenibacillus alba]|uniref:response regulator transcription factor n=1 Tax=Paenibacillus alba TaxID=1197127 RepID=UPI0015638B3A|nr:response regulator [Paenibacillus alba]NQX71389.1 response regulator [Paenibacillus alba]
MTINILIVEDEKLFRESLIRRLQLFHDLEVTATAENGIEAQLLMEKQKFDLILCDIRMPGMDGLVFLEQIRKDYGQLPVVFISGYADFDYARRALQLQASDFLTKPLNDEQLKQTIERMKALIAKQEEDSQHAARTTAAKPESVSFVELTQAWIMQHLKESSLDKLADYTRMHPAAFSRKFKQEAGVSFIQFLTQVRLEEAKRLLSDPFIKIYEVAEAVGYLDTRHFTEVFKKYEGKAPNEYRMLKVGEASDGSC